MSFKMPKENNLHKECLAQLFLWGLLFVFGISAAQSAEEVKGIHVSSFTVLPSLELGGEYISNIYRQENNQVDDFLARTKPAVGIESGWSRHALGLSASGDFANYGNHSTEDYQNFKTDLHGRLDILRNSYATARGGANRQIQLRGSADDRFGNTPTVYYDYFGEFNYFHRFNRLTANVGHHINYYSFDNVSGATGATAGSLNISPTVNTLEKAYYLHNTDRNHTTNTTYLRLGYILASGYEAFIRGNYFFKDYDQKIDDFGYARSSKGYGVDVGMGFELTALLKGDIFASYMSQEYDDPRLSSTSGVGGGMNLVWTPTRLTTVTGTFISRINETQLAGVSGFYSRMFTLGVNHELRRNIILQFHAGYGNNAYNGLQQDINGNPLVGTPQRNENIYLVGAAVKYLITREFYARAYYDYFNREVNDSTDSYDWQRVGIAIGLLY